jgi:hypothetical protein
MSLTKEDMEAVVAGIEEGRRIERRYALLQAAATIHPGLKEDMDWDEAIAVAVEAANELLERIENQEKA